MPMDDAEVVDLGRAVYTAIEIAGAAQAGAEYGIQKPTDSAGMKAVALSSASNVANVSVPTPQYGCECSDGTSYSSSCAVTPTCSTNVVYRVNVTVSTNYKSLLPWPGIPSNIHLSNSAAMRSGGN